MQQHFRLLGFGLTYSNEHQFTRLQVVDGGEKDILDPQVFQLPCILGYEKTFRIIFKT